MMMSVLGISIIWLFAIVLFEIKRRKAFYPVDFLTILNVLFILNFVIPPLGMSLVPAYERGLASIFNGTFQPQGLSINATLVALFAYVLIVATYNSLVYGRRCSFSLNGAFSRQTTHLSAHEIGTVFALVSILGMTAFYLYAHSLGGFGTMWKHSFHLRAGYMTAQFGFLKIIATLCVPSFYIALSQVFDSRGRVRFLWGGLALFCGVASVVLLGHDGSRLFFAVLVLTPILAFFSWRGRWFYLFLPLSGFVLIFFYMIADNLFNYIVLWREHDVAALGAPHDYLLHFVTDMTTLLSEFGFPYVVLSTYIELVPQSIDYRMLEDIYSGFINLMPSVLVGQDPEYILDINRAVFDAENPIDMLSFGYVAYGLTGVTVVSVLFGALIGACDLFFSAPRSFFNIIIRTAFLLQVPWLVMYGDPVNAVKRVFATSVTLVLILMFVAYRAWKDKEQEAAQ